jgi:hypothetical protein
MLPPIPRYPHDLNIIVQSESEERQIHDLVELLLDRRRLEAMITHGLSVDNFFGSWTVYRWDADDTVVKSDRQMPTAREAIDLAIEILRDRQRQASDPANASPEAKQKT